MITIWLGPAPFSPYTPSKLGAQEWRNVWDYSGGKLTDWGAHLIDTAQVAIAEEHGGPLEIDGKGEFPRDALSTTATKYEIHYRYKNDVEMIVKSGGTGIHVEGTDGWRSSVPNGARRWPRAKRRFLKLRLRWMEIECGRSRRRNTSILFKR